MFDEEGLSSYSNLVHIPGYVYFQIRLSNSYLIQQAPYSQF